MCRIEYQSAVSHHSSLLWMVAVNHKEIKQSEYSCAKGITTSPDKDLWKWFGKFD